MNASGYLLSKKKYPDGFIFQICWSWTHSRAPRGNYLLKFVWVGKFVFGLWIGSIRRKTLVIRYQSKESHSSKKINIIETWYYNYLYNKTMYTYMCCGLAKGQETKYCSIKYRNKPKCYIVQLKTFTAGLWLVNIFLDAS